VQGITSTQLNVRSEPSTASVVMGIIAASTSVQIVGQDPGGNWWQILYEAGVEGKGWVTAQYVETAVKPEVPVIGGGANSVSGNAGVVIQQLNIRSGPGTNFNSLGILNKNDVVNLTGKNRDGAWLQIEFSSGPGGRGWVSAVFIKAEALDALPIVSELGEVVGTGTPADTPLPPTPTLVAAALDFDSADVPLISVTFERNGTTSLVYRGDVSSPDGDAQDWIGFIPYTDFVYVRIECMGSNLIQVKFSDTKTGITCGQPLTAVSALAGQLNLIQILADQGAGALQYTQYTLTVKSNP
jgi:uncharacterized protein YraI